MVTFIVIHLAPLASLLHCRLLSRGPQQRPDSSQAHIRPLYVTVWTAVVSRHMPF